MSMLAERRQKQKWSLNPRGKWWTEDSNKFGQRMLEKMGWTKGKGLGANEQGITEFSATSFKNDTTGVGFDKNVEAWTEQMDKFDEFLQQLNETQDQVDVEVSNLSGQSIELKYKQSHAHYKKSTCGKGTNKHISKDAACTSDQKESVNETDNTQINTEKNSNEIKVSGCRDDWYGVVTINGGNMADYFKRKSNYKMSKYLKCNQLSSDMNLSNSMIDNRMTDFENENDQHVGFGFTSKTENISASNYGALEYSNDKSNFAFDNPCLGLNSPIKTVETCTNDFSAMSRKKRKKKFENNSYITETDKHNARKKLKTIDGDCKSGFVNPALNLETKPEEDCNGKEFEVFRTQFGLENCGLDLMDEVDDKKRVTFNDHVMLYEYNMNSTKKKKGEVTLDKFEVENKKKNKKRKCENTPTPATNGFINEALDEQILYEEINDNEFNEHRNKKVKKRKICKVSNLETIQESPEKETEEINIESEGTLDISIVENGEINIAEQKSKKKKKKKKNKEKEKQTKDEDITVLQVSNEEPDIVNEKVISKSKKIKKAKQSKEEKETMISKKYKKKKNKENCKSEKHTIQIEINSDQDIRILDKSDIETESFSLTKDEEEKELKRIKQKKKKRKSITKEDCMNEINVCNMIETLPASSFKEEEEKEFEKTKQKKKKSINKDCLNKITVYNITETLSVSIKETEEKELEKVKKKKRKSTNKEDCPNEINTEKEISDKENTGKEQDSNTKILAKKDKKSKKSKGKNVFDIEDSSNSNKEIVDANVIKQDKIENTECTDTPSKKGKISEVIDNIISSPWSVKARMSKKMLITFFHNNAILEFPGSNSHKIKGYGTDVDCEL